MSADTSPLHFAAALGFVRGMEAAILHLNGQCSRGEVLDVVAVQHRLDIPELLEALEYHYNHPRYFHANQSDRGHIGG
jgi:hypothetical protein